MPRNGPVRPSDSGVIRRSLRIRDRVQPYLVPQFEPIPADILLPDPILPDDISTEKKVVQKSILKIFLSGGPVRCSMYIHIDLGPSCDVRRSAG